MTRNTEITAEEGSTNVHADLGCADAAEMPRKSQLAAEVARAIRARRWRATSVPPALRPRVMHFWNRSASDHPDRTGWVTSS